MPFTLDGSTLNTTRRQGAANLPYTNRKYVTYTYESVMENTYTDTGTTGRSYTTNNNYSFTFDAVYGDLVSAYANRTTLKDGSPDGGVPDYDLEWNVTDGLFADSDIYAGGITPDTVLWPHIVSGDVVIDNASYAISSYQDGIPYDGIVSLDATSLIHSAGGAYDPGFAVGTDGNYSTDVTITLSGELTQTTVATTAKDMANDLALSSADVTLSLCHLDTYAKWQDPTSYIFSTVFTFAEYAQTLVTAGTVTSAANNIFRCYNRYAGGIVNLNYGVEAPEGVVVAFGMLNGVVTFSGMAHNWDEPQFGMGLRSTRSLDYLPTGLFCGNTITIVFDVYYYDTELLYPMEADGSVGGPDVGIGPVAAGLQSFSIAQLQTQLAGLGRTLGAGYIGTLTESPDC